MLYLGEWGFKQMTDQQDKIRAINAFMLELQNCNMMVCQ